MKHRNIRMHGLHIEHNNTNNSNNKYLPITSASWLSILFKENEHGCRAQLVHSKDYLH